MGLNFLNKGIAFVRGLSYIHSKFKGMKSLLNKKTKQVKIPQFIVLNEYAQVFCGLQGGYPAFSDNIEEAKPLENDAQVSMIQRGTSFKLEKYFL